MAGPHPKDDDLPVRAAVFASGRTALKSIASVSTPDHLWRALNASPIPTLDRRLQRRFARRITLRGSREAPEPTDQAVQMLALEIDYGPFEREFELPAEVDVEKARAEQENGLLWIYLPLKR